MSNDGLSTFSNVTEFRFKADRNSFCDIYGVDLKTIYYANAKKHCSCLDIPHL